MTHYLQGDKSEDRRSLRNQGQKPRQTEESRPAVSAANSEFCIWQKHPSEVKSKSKKQKIKDILR